MINNYNKNRPNIALIVLLLLSETELMLILKIEKLAETMEFLKDILSGRN